MKLYFISAHQLLISMTTAVVATALLWILTWGQAATTGVVNRTANLRAGPGTTYAIVGRATQGERVTIVEPNPAGDWYQIGDDQWIAAFLVDVSNTTLIPTATAATPIASLRATATAEPAATGPTANRNANLRAGPGTTYAVHHSGQ